MFIRRIVLVALLALTVQAAPAPFSPPEDVPGEVNVLMPIKRFSPPEGIPGDVNVLMPIKRLNPPEEAPGDVNAFMPIYVVPRM
ncbi:hypothetical protein AURDEDRAFT_163170 [Auricularia subglabra TFB-10046 SS5]|nr:hypothetical protein AURDEDRAFT_163170 [Auricularia subglabra TFB-10046 SS5]